MVLHRVIVSTVAVLVTVVGLAAAPSASADPAPPTWQRVPGPAASLPGGTLTDVSCVSATRCVAVGSHRSPQNQLKAVSEIWNGNVWRALPVLAGDGATDLAAVSCPATNACTAVGTFDDTLLAVRFDGTTWTPQTPAPVPAGLHTVAFTDVSCASTTSCLAVGTARDAGGQIQSFAQSWDGTGWRAPAFDLADPRGFAVGAVSCWAATGCEAIGWQAGPVTQAWNGTAFTAGRFALPNNLGYAEFTGISCLSGAFCAAVAGVSKCAAGGCKENAVLSEFFDGSAWRARTVPAPVSGTGEQAADDISCTSTTRCVAITRWELVFSPGVPEDGNSAATWTGGAWSPQVLRPTDVLGGSDNSLRAVSCLAGAGCQSVGGPDFYQPDRHMIAFGDTGGWHVETVQEPGNPAPTSATAVSCPAVDDCVAVGSAGALQDFVQRFDGTRWTAAPVPSVAGDHLDGVSCADATHCVAVGSRDVGPDGTRGLIVTLAGGTWTVTRLGLDDPWFGFDAVSCASASACTAVGAIASCAGRQCSSPAAYRYDGRSWTATTLPTPSGATAVAASAVSCVSALACTAVGSANDSGQQYYAARTDDGVTWALQTTPVPPGSSQASLSAVSCPGTRRCVAVGRHLVAGAGVYLDALSWNGTSWSRQQLAGPISTDGSLNGVSCASPTTCSAIGGSTRTASSPTVGFDLRAGTWVTDPPASPAAVAAVSCPAPEACLAVGKGTAQIRGM